MCLIIFALGFPKTPKNPAVLSTFIYLGCDILDDLHDNELPRDQKEYSPACASLAGSLLLSTMPVLVIGEFFDSEDARRFLACRIVGESLLKMAEGQSKDIQSRFNADLSVEEIEANVIAKSGEEMALFCRLAALAASQDIPIQQACAQWGRNLATALQIASDLADLFEETTSNDLQQGTFTVPLALHFLRLEKEEKTLFSQLWRQSSQDSEARRLVQTALRESGAVAHTALMIETACERAGESLKTIPLDPPSKEKLAALIEQVSCCSLSHLQSFFNLSSDDSRASMTLMGM